MREPVAYLNGQWIAASRMLIPATDSGFLLGVTVAEQLRTFQGRLFRLDLHLERLQHSLEIIGVDPGLPLDELGRLAEELAGRNHSLLADGDDLGLTIFITPGIYPTYMLAGTKAGPTVGLHTYPLPFWIWANQYQSGQALVVTATRQVPPECWPPSLKCRSRMHYFLADREARHSDPAARALLLNLNGEVTESSTANLVLFKQEEGLLAPPDDQILHGVSLAMLHQLAQSLGIPFHSRTISEADVLSADEAFLTSTSPCMIPVSSCNGQRIGTATPGPVFERLISAWGERVGIDIREQAHRFQGRV